MLILIVMLGAALMLGVVGASSLTTPAEGESKDDFMARCMDEGGDEASCQADWDAANPPQPQREESPPSGSLRELAEQKRKLLADNRKLLDAADKAKRPLSGEEAQEYDRREADIEKLDTQIGKLADHETRRQRLNASEESLKRPLPRQTSSSPCGNGCGDKSLSFKFGKSGTISFPAGNALASQRYRDNYSRFLRGDQGNWQSLGLKVSDDSKGGYLAPMSFVSQLIKFLDDEVFVRGLATVLPPTTAKSVGAVSFDTDVGDADWTPEVPASALSEDDSMRFGGRELMPHLDSKVVFCSQKMTRSSSINIELFVAERFGYKFGVTEEKAFLTGSGVQRPLGVFTASDNGITTSQDVRSSATTSFTLDDLTDTLMDLKAGYIGKSTWVVSREFVRRLRKMKDGIGQPLLVEDPNGEVGMQTLLGRPLVVSEFAPATFTASQYVACVGDFSNYWIQDSLNLEIQTLLELKALQNQVVWIGRKETDGMPVLAEAFRRLQMKAS